MEVKQLELFTEADFERKKTFLKKSSHWVFIDRTNRENFEATFKIPYDAVVNTIDGCVYTKGSTECKPIESDKGAIPLTVKDYLMLSDVLKNRSHCRYNKKIGEIIWK